MSREAQAVALVCHCDVVNDRAIKRAIAHGARSVADICERTGAGSGCGGCHEALEALIRKQTGAEPQPTPAAQPA